MEEDQNGMAFDRFLKWLDYHYCHHIQWRQDIGYYVFENQSSTRQTYITIQGYLDIVAIYKACINLDIPYPPIL